MAELATIARPYAEALFKSTAAVADAQALIGPMQAVAAVAGSVELRRFADDPKVEVAQIVEVIGGVMKTELDAKIGNLLRLVIANGRLEALPEIAEQFAALVKAQSGTADAVIHSAFAIDEAQLAQVVATLEKRFGRKLSASVAIDPTLIGGIRVVVGDEVLDASVKARLEKMKTALIA